MTDTATDARPLRLIDRILEAEAGDRQPLTVEEWGVTLYFPKLTVADAQAAYAGDGEKSGLERQLNLLIAKAQLEDRTPAFTTGDREYLRSRCSLTVLQKVFTFMYAAVLPGNAALAAAEQQVATDPTSAGA